MGTLDPAFTAKLLAAIVESSDDAIISKDVDGIGTSWNRGAERIFGYSAQEMIGRPIRIIAPPDRSDEMPTILARIRNGERIEHYETVRRAKGGRLVNISLTVSPVYDADGQIIGASKIARDISEQIRMRAELAHERERLRVTLQSIGDGVITTDQNGRVTYLNPVARDLTGWSNSEAIGRPLEEVFRIINEETRATVENPATKVLRDGIIVGLANHTLLISRDGIARAIDDSGAPIRMIDGKIAGVVLVFRDVSARRATEHEMSTAAKELRKANEELSQFAYAISHDVREPLRNVANFTQLLMEHCGERLDDRARTYTGFIVSGAHRMESLLDDLLAYTQATGENTATAIIDLNEALRIAQDNLHLAIARYAAVVTTGTLPLVRGHQAALVSVFQNLLGNAIRYRSAEPPRVHVSASQGEGEYVFAIADNGIGIERQFHSQIFGLFKRLHGQEIPGSGLGLALCAKIIERHGGRIWVDSKPGKGSTFYFSLPSTTRD
jgi:PAS domain S-box-containing protein